MTCSILEKVARERILPPLKTFMASAYGGAVDATYLDLVDIYYGGNNRNVEDLRGPLKLKTAGDQPADQQTELRWGQVRTLDIERDLMVGSEPTLISELLGLLSISPEGR